MTSFTKKAEQGISWTTISTIITSVVKLLQVAILTRFLEKEAFGTIAIATLFIGFTELFLDMGLGAAILHKQDIPRSHYSSLFWLNVFTGILLMLILFAVSPLIGIYYEDKALVPIIFLLSTNVFFSSLGRQHQTIRRKKLDFKFIGILKIISSIFTISLAVLLAVKGYGVYSLVYSTMLSVILPNIVFLIHGVKKDKNVYFHFSIKETQSYLKIGMYLIFSRVLDYISREIDIFIISSAFGKDILGVYSLCKKLVIMFYSTLTSVLMNVLTPLLAELQKDFEDLKQKFLKVVKFISTFSFPVFILVAVFSEGILRILYGSDYAEYHVILSFLAVNFGISMVGSAVSASQVALGRTDVGFHWTVFRVITSTIVVFIASQFSVYIVAFSILLLTIVYTYPFWYIVVRTILKIPFLDYLNPQLLPFGVSAILGGIIYLLMPGFVSIAFMISVGILFAVAYYVSIKLIMPANLLINYIEYRIKSIF